MPILGNLFGKKKKSEQKQKTTGQTIQSMRETEDLLIKKQEFLEKKIATETILAKKYGMANKRLAIQALKRKKRFEKQLQQIDGTLSTIEMQRETLEGAHTNTAVLKTMTEAAKALKTAHQHLDVDKVHDMMDDIAEQQDVSREITDAISSPISFGNDVDDEELERELELLEQEGLEEALLTVGPLQPKLSGMLAPPKVIAPAQVKENVEGHPRPRDEDDDEMKELAAWAS